MIVDLPCGREKVRLRLSEGARARAAVVETLPFPPLPDPEGAVAEALRAPLGAEPLERLARGRRSACVVVSDGTRPVPNRVVLPPLLRALEAAGLPREAVTLLVATGMHRPATAAEVAELLGPDVAGGYRVVSHDCRDRAALRRVDSVEGTPIEVNRTYLDADLKILTGLIEPHSFAGFSGGGKSVVPGLASFETMAFLHSYAMVERLEGALGRVRGNPFRAHVHRACRLAGVDFIVNVLVDRDRRIGCVVAGDVEEAFLAGCEAAGRHQTVRVERPADLVLTTGGGAPLDRSFYQANKGLVAARGFLRPGGTLALVAGCEEGLGAPGFVEVVRRSGSAAGFRERYGRPEHFTADQWAAQAVFQTLEHAGRTLVYAPGLSRQELAFLGIEKVEDPSALEAEIEASEGRVCLVPEGPYVSPVAADP